MKRSLPRVPETKDLREVHAALIECRACPRLVRWREEVAREKVKRFRAQTYWGRPVPGFGDPKARMLIVGLAPAAHGANRTGRMFTGDRSGDFLYAGLHRLGFARIATSTAIDDGQKLSGAFITAPCRCAPPENKPTPAELKNCAPWLEAELSILPPLRVVLALGSIGWHAALKAFARRGQTPVSDVEFGHGAEVQLSNGPVLLGSYHVSQQNTQTGRLTEAMFDAVLARARSLVNATGA